MIAEAAIASSSRAATSPGGRTWSEARRDAPSKSRGRSPASRALMKESPAPTVSTTSTPRAADDAPCRWPRRPPRRRRHRGSRRRAPVRARASPPPPPRRVRPGSSHSTSSSLALTMSATPSTSCDDHRAPPRATPSAAAGRSGRTSPSPSQPGPCRQPSQDRTTRGRGQRRASRRAAPTTPSSAVQLVVGPLPVGGPVDPEVVGRRAVRLQRDDRQRRRLGGRDAVREVDTVGLQVRV